MTKVLSPIETGAASPSLDLVPMRERTRMEGWDVETHPCIERKEKKEEKKKMEGRRKRKEKKRKGEDRKE